MHHPPRTHPPSLRSSTQQYLYLLRFDLFAYQWLLRTKYICLVVPSVLLYPTQYPQEKLIPWIWRAVEITDGGGRVDADVAQRKWLNVTGHVLRRPAFLIIIVLYTYIQSEQSPFRMHARAIHISSGQSRRITVYSSFGVSEG